MSSENHVTIVEAGTEIGVMTLLVGNPGQGINKGHGSHKPLEFEPAVYAFEIQTYVPTGYLAEILLDTIWPKGIDAPFAWLAFLVGQITQTLLLGLTVLCC